MYERAKYLSAGDKGLVVEFGNSIARDINNKVRSFALAVEKACIPGIVEYIPSYRSLLILYDPLVWKVKRLVSKLQELENNLALMDVPEPRVYYVPVAYGGDLGPDLNFLCRHTGMAREDVISIHTGGDYLIYMLGFTPGFPYLGGMDHRIAAPRLDTPRSEIPAGSVGIAGNQTGIYPVASPGGWRLIGRTPVKLFNPLEKAPALLNSGDYVRFYAITEQEYFQITKEVDKGEFQIKTSRWNSGEG